MQIPSKTSVHKKETKHKKFSIRFAPELVDFIKEGKKWKTYRFGDKYDYMVKGDEVNIIDQENNIVGKAVVVKKEYTTFGQLPLNTEGHEPYRDKEHKRQVLSGYYAYIGREIEDNDKFLILTFELLELES